MVFYYPGFCLSLPTVRQALSIRCVAPAYRQAGYFAVHSPLSIWEIQKPLFSMGLNGCKDNTLTNPISLYYPLNFCVHDPQSHCLCRMFSTTYHNPSKNMLEINNYTWIGIDVWAGIACYSLSYC